VLDQCGTLIFVESNGTICGCLSYQKCLKSC